MLLFQSIYNSSAWAEMCEGCSWEVVNYFCKEQSVKWVPSMPNSCLLGISLHRVRHDSQWEERAVETCVTSVFWEEDVLGSVLVTQSCPTIWNRLDCGLPGSSVHGILQSRILEGVAIPFFRGSSSLRDWTWVPWFEGRFFTVWATDKLTWGNAEVKVK